MIDLKNGISVVKFGTEWCTPCKIVNKLLIKMQQEFETINFISIDVDDYPELGKYYKIKNLPTILLFSDKKEINRIIGAVKTESLRKAIRDSLKHKAA